MKRLIMGVAVLALTGIFFAPHAWAAAETGTVAPSVELEIERLVKEGTPIKEILWKYVDAGLDVSDVVRMLHKAGADDGSVVKDAIAEGFSAKQVVKASVMAGADLKTVVAAAHNAGAKDGDITQGAKDAGVKPETAATALAEAKGTPFAFTPPPAAMKPAFTPPVLTNLGGAPPSTVASPVI